MGIHNTHMYEKAIVAMAKQSVTLEVLSYHASASIDEAHRLRVSFFFFGLIMQHVFLISMLKYLWQTKNGISKNKKGFIMIVF